MVFMALINIVVLVILYKPVAALLKHYINQWNQEKIPVYIKGDIPEIESEAITQWDGSDADSVK